MSPLGILAKLSPQEYMTPVDIEEKLDVVMLCR